MIPLPPGDVQQADRLIIAGISQTHAGGGATLAFTISADTVAKIRETATDKKAGFTVSVVPSAAATRGNSLLSQPLLFAHDPNLLSPVSQVDLLFSPKGPVDLYRKRLGSPSQSAFAWDDWDLRIEVPRLVDGQSVTSFRAAELCNAGQLLGGIGARAWRDVRVAHPRITGGGESSPRLLHALAGAASSEEWEGLATRHGWGSADRGDVALAGESTAANELFNKAVCHAFTLEDPRLPFLYADHAPCNSGSLIRERFVAAFPRHMLSLQWLGARQERDWMTALARFLRTGLSSPGVRPYMATAADADAAFSHINTFINAIMAREDRVGLLALAAAAERSHKLYNGRPATLHGATGAGAGGARREASRL